jgi:HPt (histidine-containing phosphotransfer) domain-containing protein
MIENHTWSGLQRDNRGNPNERNEREEDAMMRENSNGKIWLANLVAKSVGPERMFGGLTARIKPAAARQQRAEPRSSAPSDTPEKSVERPRRRAEDKVAVTLPAEVAGIDLDAARTALGNNEALLAKLLVDFRERYMDYADKISAALDEGATETAERTAHSLKGVSGLICATRVYAAAAAVDEVLRTNPGADRLPALLSSLTDALNEVERGLSKVTDGR